MKPKWKTKKTKYVIYWDRVAAVALVPVLAFTLFKAAFPTNIVEYEEREVVVEQGDTLWNIAKDAVGETEDVRQTVSEIIRKNNLHNGIIHPGMILKIRAVKE
nr:MAG TPA: LysM domain [Caudoviricetes sp.]